MACDQDPHGFKPGVKTDLPPGGEMQAPTWTFWGWTSVYLCNLSNTEENHIAIQAGGAGPVWVDLPPAGARQTEGQWAGFPVHILNSSETVGVRVWVW